MTKPQTGYFWSSDPDAWTLEPPYGPYPTREAALAAAVPRIRPDGDRGPTHWVGLAFDVTFNMRPFGAAMVDEAQEQALSQAGDDAENWPGSTDDQVKELGEALQKVFSAWIGKYKFEPDFVGLTEIEGHGAVPGHSF